MKISGKFILKVAGTLTIISLVEIGRASCRERV